MCAGGRYLGVGERFAAEGETPGGANVGGRGAPQPHGMLQVRLDRRGQQLLAPRDTIVSSHALVSSTRRLN